jgi:hypothetical protein
VSGQRIAAGARAGAVRTWIPRRISLSVMVGTQSFSSLRMERQMVPLGKTLGWKMGGVNLHFGGCAG